MKDFMGFKSPWQVVDVIGSKWRKCPARLLCLWPCPFMFTRLADEEGGKEVAFSVFLPKKAVENSCEWSLLNYSSRARWEKEKW